MEVEDEDEAAEVAAEFKGAEANAEFENFETLRLFTGATLRATEAVFVAAVAWEKKLRFAAVRAEISDARRTMEIIYWTRERESVVLCDAFFYQRFDLFTGQRLFKRLFEFNTDDSFTLYSFES